MLLHVVNMGPLEVVRSIAALQHPPAAFFALFAHIHLTTRVNLKLGPHLFIRQDEAKNGGRTAFNCDCTPFTVFRKCVRMADLPRFRSAAPSPDSCTESCFIR